MTKIKNIHLSLFTNDILERSHAYFSDVKRSFNSNANDILDNQFSQFEQKSHQLAAEIDKLRPKMLQ